MSFNFILAHLNVLTLGIWVTFFCVVLVRFLRPLWVKNISYQWFIVVAVMLHIFYAVFITWGQYYIWATSSEFTRALLSAPLPVETPLPAIFEWVRPYFSHSLGYFAYYAFGRFFLNIIVLFAVTGIFYVVFRFLHLCPRVLPQITPPSRFHIPAIFRFFSIKNHSPYPDMAHNFLNQKNEKLQKSETESEEVVCGRTLNNNEEQLPELVCSLMLVVGWPGIVVLVPLGFVVAIFFSLGALIFFKRNQVSLAPAFLFATPIAIIGSKAILNLLHLYSLLEL